MRIHLRSTLLKKILSAWYRMAYYRHYVPVLSFQSCPTLCDPMDCSPVGFSVHGILQAKMLEWVAAPSSQGSSWPRDWVHVSCIAGRFFTTEPLGKPSRHCFVQQISVSNSFFNSADFKRLNFFYYANISKKSRKFNSKHDFCKSQRVFFNLKE